MFDFLRDLANNGKQSVTVIVVDDDSSSASRQYRIHPSRMLPVLISTAAAIVVLTFLILAFTPVRQIVPSLRSDDMTRDIRLASIRVAALEDSLLTQMMYADQLRRILTGDMDTSSIMVPEDPQADLAPTTDLPNYAADQLTDNWADHEQPALSITRMPVAVEPPPDYLSSYVPRSPGAHLSALRPPVEPPVDGFVTRGFDARRGHFGLDIAVEVGSIVRSIGDGYVIFSDWSNDGGYVIALQHAGGFVSVYKHNESLLKQVGDRIKERDPIAISGNTGEITTGPHLHFELWHDGLAQDPRQFFLGW